MGMFIFASSVGVTINVLSLFAMIIVIGILVDDGIVIAENIYHHYEKGKTRVQAAIDGTLEVIPPIVSAILTTLLAFGTFLFLVIGLLGAIALGAAGVVALVVSGSDDDGPAQPTVQLPTTTPEAPVRPMSLPPKTKMLVHFKFLLLSTMMWDWNIISPQLLPCTCNNSMTLQQ